MVSKKIVIAIALGLMMVLAVSVSASQVVTLNTILTGDLGSLTLNAKASTADDVVWCYEYWLTSVSPQGTPANPHDYVHSFSIGNPGRYSFYDAGNDGGYTSPAFSGTSSVLYLWQNTAEPTATTVKFWYYSIYSPIVVPTHALDGGTGVYGKTLGMVPEPMSMLLGTLGLGCVAGLKRLRRK